MVKYLLIALLFIGCATVQPVCRHDAMYNAYVMSDKYPVRMAMGTRGMDLHTQAQAKIDGEWEYLENSFGGVGAGKKDRGFFVTDYMGFNEFIERYVLIK